MAKFIEKTLEPGEQIVFRGRLHWYFNFRYTVWGVLLNILGLSGIAFVASQDAVEGALKVLLVICFIICLIGVGSILYGCILRNKTEFAVTNTRFIQKDGLLTIRLTEIPLFKVETVNFEQTFIERIIGTGAIELVGSGGTNHVVRFIKEPFEVRKLITMYMKESKGEQQSPAASPASAPITTGQTGVQYTYTEN